MNDISKYNDLTIHTGYGHVPTLANYSIVQNRMTVLVNYID